MTEFDRATLVPVAAAERLLVSKLAGYAGSRQWTKTATARWLNERAAAVNAAGLRHGWQLALDARGRNHALPLQPGYTLKERHAAIFSRIHSRLTALPSDAARDAALVPAIVR